MVVCLALTLPSIYFERLFLPGNRFFPTFLHASLCKLESNIVVQKRAFKYLNDQAWRVFLVTQNFHLFVKK